MKKLILLLSLFLLMINVPLFSEGTEDHLYNYSADKENFISRYGDLPFERMDIVGLERTGKYIILRDARMEKDMPVSSFQADAFVNRLHKRGIFTDISMSYSEENGKAVIHLSLKEKHSFIPVPLVISRKDRASIGIMVMDSNFLGITKLLLAGFMAGSDDLSFFTMYRDPSVAGSRFIGQMILSWKSSEEKRMGLHQITENRFCLKKTDAGLFGGYKITDGIELLAGGGISLGKNDRNWKDSLNPPEDCRYIAAAASLKTENLRYGNYLSYGFTGQTSFIRYFAADGRSKNFCDLETSLKYSFNIFRNDRITLTGAGNFFSKPLIYEKKIGGKTGATCLPSKTTTADQNLLYAAEYEYALSFLRFSWGAATLMGCWEQGIYERDNTGWQKYCGPGFGTRIYLKKIAFPAMGLTCSWNLMNGETEFSFSLGMTL